MACGISAGHRLVVRHGPGRDDIAGCMERRGLYLLRRRRLHPGRSLIAPPLVWRDASAVDRAKVAGRATAAGQQIVQRHPRRPRVAVVLGKVPRALPPARVPRVDVGAWRRKLICQKV